MKNHYIQAVLQMIEADGNPTEIVSGLSRTLKVRGHEKLYGTILRGVYRVLCSKRSSKVTLVTVARESAFAKYESEIANALSKLDAQGYEKKVDESLIGGVVVAHNNVVIDMSYKTKLVNLFRSLTK